VSVRIRLARHGAKKAPFYHVVAADQRAKRDGRYLEKLGTYNPKDKENGIKINSEAVKKWLATGAQPTETVVRLLKKTGVEVGQS